MQTITKNVTAGQKIDDAINVNPNASPCTVTWAMVGTWPSWARVQNGRYIAEPPVGITPDVYDHAASLYCAEDPDCAQVVTFSTAVLDSTVCNKPAMAVSSLAGEYASNTGGTLNFAYTGDTTVVASLVGGPAGATVATIDAANGRINIPQGLAAGVYTMSLKLENSCGELLVPVTVTITENCVGGNITYPPNDGGGGSNNCVATSDESPDGSVAVGENFLRCFPNVVTGPTSSGAATGVVTTADAASPNHCVRVTAGNTAGAYTINFQVDGEDCSISGTVTGGGGGGTNCANDDLAMTWNSTTQDDVGPMELEVQSGSQVPSSQMCFNFDLDAAWVANLPAGVSVLQWQAGGDPAKCLTFQSSTSAVPGDYNFNIPLCGGGTASIPIKIVANGGGGGTGACPTFSTLTTGDGSSVPDWGALPAGDYIAEYTGEAVTSASICNGAGTTTDNITVTNFNATQVFFTIPANASAAGDWFQVCVNGTECLQGFTIGDTSNGGGGGGGTCPDFSTLTFGDGSDVPNWGALPAGDYIAEYTGTAITGATICDGAGTTTDNITVTSTNATQVFFTIPANASAAGDWFQVCVNGTDCRQGFTLG